MPDFPDRSGPTLSLAMIVKDEVDTIERCLDSARPHVDELVVVDTGSTDGTRQIVRGYADVCSEIEWPDSFAEARNHSYDLAEGDYIMYMDGDEYLPEESHWKQIRRALATREVGLLRLRVCNLLPEESLLEAQQIWQARIVPNHPSVRWEGCVHNQIAGPAERHADREGLESVRVPARILHTGYALDPEAKRAKYEGRVELLHRAVRGASSANERAYYRFQQALVYYVLGRYDSAHAILSDLDFAALGEKNRFHAACLGARSVLAAQGMETSKAYSFCQRMLETASAEPVGYYLFATVLLMEEHFIQGVSVLLDAYLRAGGENQDVQFPIDREHVLDCLEDLVSQGMLSGPDSEHVVDKIRTKAPAQVADRLLGLMPARAAG